MLSRGRLCSRPHTDASAQNIEGGGGRTVSEIDERYSCKHRYTVASRPADALSEHRANKDVKIFAERSERSKKVRVSGARGDGGMGTLTCGSVMCSTPVRRLREKTTHEENHTENTTQNKKPGPRWEALGPPPWTPEPQSSILCHSEMLRWAPILPSSGPCGHPRAPAHPPQTIRASLS